MKPFALLLLPFILCTSVLASGPCYTACGTWSDVLRNCRKIFGPTRGSAPGTTEPPPR